MPRLLSLCLLITAVTLAGCEEAVVPTSSGGLQFTLYGALDPKAQTQAVRVVPIRDRLEIPAPGPLDASFTSTDLTTGEERVWRDSVVVLADGSSANVFVAPFRAQYGHTYRLVADAEGGLPASVVVEVPPRVEPLRRGPFFTSEGVSEEVRWLGAPRLNAARVHVALASQTCEPYDLSLEADVAGPVEFGWSVPVSYSQIALEVNREFGVSPSALAILRITVDADVASAAWVPPGGVFDPEALVEPGAFTNVTNGFGFVGASYPTRAQWAPSSEAQLRAGFRPLPAGQCQP